MHGRHPTARRWAWCVDTYDTGWVRHPPGSVRLFTGMAFTRLLGIMTGRKTRKGAWPAACSRLTIHRGPCRRADRQWLASRGADSPMQVASDDSWMRTGARGIGIQLERRYGRSRSLTMTGDHID